MMLLTRFVNGSLKNLAQKHRESIAAQEVGKSKCFAKPLIALRHFLA